MKAFRYGLQSVLRVRRLQQDARIGELAAAAAGLRAGEQALDAVRRRVDQELTDAPGLRSPSAAPWMLALHDQCLARLQRVRRREQTRVDDARKAERHARERLLEAHREARKVEAHRDQARQAWIEDVRRAEDKHLDEIAGRRHRHRPEPAP